MEHQTEVLIIGAGLSGLTAAKILTAAGRSIKVLEASDGIGGRVRTDLVDGYQLDRGFQVLLTAYPEARQILDYQALDLRYFDPGAIILKPGEMTSISDPIRKPAQFWTTLMSSAGTLGDKFRMLALRSSLKKRSIKAIFRGNATTTLDYLRDFGFSDKIIRNFFQPFFSGVFLETELSTPGVMFEYLFKMFSEGGTAIPAKGMGQIPKQLALTFSEDITLNEKAMVIDGNSVRTQRGNTYTAEKILVATNLVDLPFPLAQKNAAYRSVYNLYFTAERPPVDSPAVIVDALPEHVVNNIAVMNNIAPEYGPPGRFLISVSVINDRFRTDPLTLPETVKTELSHWFNDAPKWQYLRTYDIPFALPLKENYSDFAPSRSFKISDYLYQCGDHMLNGSINGAIKSGRLAAEAIIAT